MKVCVFGAGAIGGYIAGLLAASGVKTSVVARGPHLGAVRVSGLRVELPGRQVQSRVAASDRPAELGLQDVVIVTVKAPALPSVAATIAPLLRPDTPVVFVMNGIPWWYFHRNGGAWEGRQIALLDPDGKLWEQVGPDRVIGGIAWAASSVPEPGVVRVLSEMQGVTLGEPDGSLSPRVQSVAEVFRGAGLPVSVNTKIRDLIWQKLIFNLSAGPMCVLAASPVEATQEEQDLVAASRRMVAEAEAVARAVGRAPEVDLDHILAVNQRHSHRPSILQDLEVGRPMEIDALYSVFQNFARMVTVPTPTLDLLFALIRVRARQAGLYSGSGPGVDGRATLGYGIAKVIGGSPRTGAIGAALMTGRSQNSPVPQRARRPAPTRTRGAACS